MEVHSPYLLGDGDDGTGSRVSVLFDVDTAVIEMVVFGRWTRRLALNIYTAFRKCLAEHPPAIFVDLRQLADPSAASTAMWLAAARAADGLQPPVQIALILPSCDPLSERLHSIGGTRTIPTFSAVETARAAVGDHALLTERLQLTRLPPEAGSAKPARGLIDVACRAWGFLDLQHPGRLVISELVANAVQHTGTQMTVTVSRRRTGLHLSVRDGDARLPRLRQPSSGDQAAQAGSGGHGLRIVDTLAASWGAISTRDGKVVWATMRSYRRPAP
jgi:anti-sigma regulatory factor (Ser/Thr protein kinase)